MPAPIVPADVVVGLLTENTTRMVAQATRLLRSIHWFGGRLAESRVVVCTVGRLDAESERELRELGAELRVVSRFHPANPTANRHQLIAELLDAPEPLLFLLDCDTIVARDPLPYLDLVNFQAKIAPTPTVSDGVFERLFPHFGIPKPPRSHVTGLDGTPTIPYFNGGVLAIPREIARRLAPSWRKYNKLLADEPELVMPCERHMHQAALSLALAETGVPTRALPLAMNFQINATHVAAPAGWATTDPVIVHYHHLASEDGLLMTCPYPGVQARVARFNDRMRAEGFVAPARPSTPAAQSRPVFVLGMHRSGTSLMAQAVNALGVYAGRPDKLTPPDIYNPTGFWEYSDVVKLDDEILGSLGGTWADVASVDSSRLQGETRAALLERARRATDPLRGHGPFLLKDPRISLLVPFWSEALGDPVCVIVWRHPVVVARSLRTRNTRFTMLSLALWEHYNRVVLRDTEKLPRLLVSYDEFLAAPERTLQALVEGMRSFGVEAVATPDASTIRQIVTPDFNRSGREEYDDTLLDDDQRALLAALRSGEVLATPVPPTSARTMELLRGAGEAHAENVRLRRELDGKAVHARDLQSALELRDRLLEEVFASRSWRLGHAATSLVRRLLRTKDVSAEERWKSIAGPGAR